MNKSLSFFCLSFVCFLFSISFSSCKKDDTCEPGTTAVAGDDQIIPGTSVTLDANTPTVGEGTWSIVSGEGGSFDDVHSSTALFTGNAGVAYDLRWTISGCPESLDDIIITFTTDPTITTIDKTSVIDGEIITVTGFNFSANYSGNSQIILRKTGGDDWYSTILSLTSTEIKFVVANTTLETFTIVYLKRETAAAGTEFPSTFDVTINAPGVSQFFVGSTLPSNNVNAGDNLIASVKNGGSSKDDYTVKLINYNSVTGASLEYNATTVSFTPGTTDALEFTVPSDIPTGLGYRVSITYNGTTLITGWNGTLIVN